ncbi:MAG: hypothetical protein CMK07_05080 [Ponticaulis sp.]|nr:hypothetical protein [Ponticaulis sp.]
MSDVQKAGNGGDQGKWFWIGTGVVIAGMLGLGGYFGQSKPRPAASSGSVVAFSCEPIPDGMDYKGGKLVPLRVSVPAGEVVPMVSMPSPWLPDAERSIGALGFPWVSLVVDGLDVHVAGVAPSNTSKTDAFEVARRVIRRSDTGNLEIASIRNDILVQTGSPVWATDIEAAVQSIGFDWLNLTVRGPVATVSGTAPNQSAADEAFTFASEAIDGNSLANSQIVQLINGISVDGEGASAVEALVQLSQSEEETLTVSACQATFNSTMEGRNIEFETGSSALSERSTRLLDALTGIAILCTNSSGYTVEVGGHTDARGSDANNLILSEQRAVSVRNYLINLGVEAERLNAKGYGDTMPVMDGDTAEAYARNRRTEFKVAAAD